jgi:hypothetical protein
MLLLLLAAAIFMGLGKWVGGLLLALTFAVLLAWDNPLLRGFAKRIATPS